MKILNKKKYKDYIKRIYIDISEPEAESFDLRSHNMLDLLCSHMINDKDKENVQAFTHCTICIRLCVISGGGDKDKNDKMKYEICYTCWRNLSGRSYTSLQ